MEKHNSTIFICYRRSDTHFETDAIYRELVDVFGKEKVFKDEENVGPAEKFMDRITSTLKNTSALVVVIGPNWLDAEDTSGNRRLEAKNDYVRREIEAAIESKTPIIPVLVGGIDLPSSQHLPHSIRGLLDWQKIEIRPGKYYHDDIKRLIEGLGGKVAEKKGNASLWVGLGLIPISIGIGLLPADYFYDRKYEPEFIAERAMKWKTVGVLVSTLILLSMGPVKLNEKGGFFHRITGKEPKKVHLIFIGLIWMAIAVICAAVIEKTSSSLEQNGFLIMTLGWASLMASLGVFLFVAFYQGNHE
ncbi:MAG: toll/interleukin-1 receptor domain-containing protein [Verrucomicrobiales bacterium]|nr:toll/interleukin-1 receptor domain-containing protein [Verrucomicrobiales bacterium]